MTTRTDSRAKSVSDVFKAAPYSVFEFYAKAGQGLYVPAYQRPYSWDKVNIARLIEDVCHGFRMLGTQPDTVTFLGTIIAINDTQHKTISPLVRGKVPSRVMTIIDGQQRLTTLLILATALHETLRLAARKFLKSSEEHDIWLLQEIQRQLGELNKTYEEDQAYGTGSYQYYPRMIRSFVDQWSTDQQARYHSPLAWHLHKYGEHVRATLDAPKKYVPSTPQDVDEQLKNAHEAFQERVNAIRKALRILEEGPAKAREDEPIEAPSWEEASRNASFQQALLNNTEFPSSVLAVLSKEETEFHKALRVLLFSRFLLTRVGLTVVEATNEDSAFDLFEALNTTGEPLTAYETFKPKVIQQEDLEHLANSLSHKSLQVIDEYLSRFKKTDEKQEATRNLVVSFALAESGEKRSRHLSDQRRYLRDTYEDQADAAGRLAFVQHLSRCATFYGEVWPPESVTKPSFGELDSMISETSRISVDFLRQSNHTITISPLTRFYAVALDAKDSGDAQALKTAVREFEEAIRAIASFWTLWRASRAGTESIDSYYRSLMQSRPTGDDSLECPERFLSLARIPSKDSTGATPNAMELKRALRAILMTFGKIDSAETWIQRASSEAAAKTKAVTRFLLLSALHDSPADVASPGLNEKGVTGSVNLLTFDTWRALQTIEHIAPERPDVSNDWDPQLYADQKNREYLDSLGNLTLLPHEINSSISNRTWRSKNYMYRVISSPTQAAMDALLQQAQSFNVNRPTQELLDKKTTYMAQIDALAKVTTPWTLDLVHARSKRLAELAWDRLSVAIDWPASAIVNS